jgi:carbamoyltransferase
MYILGLNVFHGDCSACLFKDDKLIAAIEEERITRIKHAAGFPINSIKFCLDFAKIDISDIDHVAINRNPNLRFFTKSIYALKNVMNTRKIFDRIKNYKKINSLEDEFQKHFSTKLKNKVFLVDHHLAHAASSVLMSNFDDCNYITIDGFGDFLSTTIGKFSNQKFNTIQDVKFPHSLGLFYTAITQFLGFKKYGDEYKVMGLSSYGKPIYVDKINKLVRFDYKNLFKLNLDYFKHHNEGVEMSWLDGEPKLGDVFSDKLIDLLGHPREKDDPIESRHMDIASSTQIVFEEITIKILNRLYELNSSDNLCLSGGCAMNSVFNGKILQNTKYKNIYINHSPGDSGGSIGAGMIAINKIYKKIVKIEDTPYLGPNYTMDEIKIILDNYSDKFEKLNIKIIELNNNEDLVKSIVKNLSLNKVIGLFQGRMEFGSRALGNRSIICDPRNPNIKDLLNLKIKNREQFRPFAPSVLLESVSDWFENNDDVPFMSKVHKIKKEKAELVPGVVHVDGTCRLQSVSKINNSLYYDIIEKFKETTGIPMILNTSFNENEPIVCKPEEAINCFLRTKMDNLFIEKYLIFRKES